jgi:hypothetical protein
MLISDRYYLKTKYNAWQVVKLLLNLACNLYLKSPWICLGNNTLESTKIFGGNYTLDIFIMIFNDIEIYTNTWTNIEAHAYTLHNFSNYQE